MSLYLKSRDSVQQQRKRMESRDPVLEQLKRGRELGSIVSKRVLIRQTRTKTVMFSRDMWGRKRDGITRNLWGMESRELWGMEPREIICMLGYVRQCLDSGVHSIFQNLENGPLFIEPGNLFHILPPTWSGNALCLFEKSSQILTICFVCFCKFANLIIALISTANGESGLVLTWRWRMDRQKI